MDGIRSPDLVAASNIEELLGNKTEDGLVRTRRVPVSDFATQLVTSGPVRDAINVLSGNSPFLTPQSFDAAGDGSTDDTAAMVEWAAACQAEGRQPYVPAGIYPCSSLLDFSSTGGAILGAGENLSIIRFTGSGAGFKCYPTGSPYGVFSLDRIGLQASAVVTKAVDVVLPNDGDFSNNFRTGFRNVELLGVSGGYFATGVRERNVCFSERRRVKYWGSSANPTALSGYYAGVAWDFDTQTVGDDPANGLSLENIWDGCSVAFCDTAVKARGFPEGLYFRSNNFAFVRKGIDAVAQTGTRQPLVNVIGNHINATEFCILADRFNQSQFIGNHIARPNGEWAYAWIGIDLDDSLNAVLTGNTIVPEIVSIPAGDTTGIRLSGDSWFAAIDVNQFIGAITADYKPLTNAIRIETGVQGTKIGNMNQYSGLITNPVSDGSGNGTNGTPGITVQKAGVTQGTAGMINLLNFNADFNVSPSGGAASIDVA